MASTFSTNLQFELQQTGDHKAIWGQRANNVFEMVEDAIAGFAQVPMADANQNLTQSGDGNYYVARNAMLEFTGAMTANRTVTIPSVSKIYILKNSTTGGFSIVVTVGVNTYTLLNGQTRIVYTDGASIGSSDTMFAGNHTYRAVQNLTGISTADFTSIPDVSRITVYLNTLDISTADSILIRLGSAVGGFETTGYQSLEMNTPNASANVGTTSNNGIGIHQNGAYTSGILSLYNFRNTNFWLFNGIFNGPPGGDMLTINGFKGLSGTLDRLRITTAAGGIFTTANGGVNLVRISYET